MTDPVERMEWGMDRPESWAKHLFRYGFAASFLKRGDVVLDAACGNGYGRAIIEGHGATWFGADKTPPDGALKVDLESWVPSFGFDVFIGLETIEHLNDPTAYIAAAKMARRLVILSTPIVPTTHFNPFHERDVTKDEINGYFEDWGVERFEEQEEVYGLFCFRSPDLPKFKTASDLESRVSRLESAEWQDDEVDRMIRSMPARDPDGHLL